MIIQKNFHILYDEEKDSWRLSPAYDLTYSSTYYGEHTTTVDGNGRNPMKGNFNSWNYVRDEKKRYVWILWIR